MIVLGFLQLQAERTDISILEQPHLQASFRSPSNQEMDELEAGIAAHEARVLEMNANYGRLLKRWIELNEQKYVLRETAIFFQEAEGREEEYRRNSLEINADNSPLLRDISVMEGGGDEGHTLGFVAGVIDRERMPTFERILWRALRGNLYLNHAEIEDAIADPESDELVLKNVFVIFAHGREILAKIRKISESLGATLYPVDSTMEARREAALEVMGRLDDVQRVLDNTKQARRHELMTVAENLNAWMLMVRKEKAIYYTMNLFDYDRGGRSLVAEGWCPSDEIPAINYTLRTVSVHIASI
jgi:V-type H+-transporting ATPase subunit a